MADYPYRWAVQWRSQNNIDGYTERLVWDWEDPLRTTPLLLRTRKEARELIKERYGYIKRRPDLRAEPHGWKMPRPVKVLIEIKPA